MRTALTIAAVGLATPAHAVGVGDLARVVLGNGAVLQKGAETCPDKLTLGFDEMLALTTARQAARSALSSEQFVRIESAATATAAKASQSSQFCNKTAKRKSVLLDAVKRAGERLVTARVLKL